MPRSPEAPCRDPTLTSEYIKHFSSGIQHGDGRHNASELQIMSTCKHFFGYDIEFRESRPLGSFSLQSRSAGARHRLDRMRNDVNISARMLTEYYLPAFKACVQGAKVKSIMCSCEHRPVRLLLDCPCTP